MIQAGNNLIPVIVIEEKVYNGACEGDGFHRFTIAYEIGHTILHFDDLCFSRSIRHRENNEWFRDSEWQVNTFAEEFLEDIRYIYTSLF
jgi:Zn-dependent peptidase ImmA (M78 family)